MRITVRLYQTSNLIIYFPKSGSAVFANKTTTTWSGYYKIKPKTISVALNFPGNSFEIAEKYKALNFNRTINNQKVFLPKVTSGLDSKGRALKAEQLFSLNVEVANPKKLSFESMTSYQKEVYFIASDVRKIDAWANAGASYIDVSSLEPDYL